MEEIFEYITSTVTLNETETQDTDNVLVPDGTIVGIAAVISGNTESRIINLSMLQNNFEVVRAADVRFSERTSGGSFKESMRPVNLPGGRNYETRIVALSASTTEKVSIQVMFMISKKVPTQY
ncbi:hypothetical protein [Flavobacterium fluviatile]|uniref:hypothetical protein n=1 Tax=Flavobacterium fluviatile TaxID=1862387 RepID=UPI0013CF61CE|nr:hypothetical protein [Flavobacterium fluviatile]